MWVALALLPLLALGTWLVTRPRAPTLTPARLPAGPIKGSVDLLVYRIDRTGSDVLVPLSHPLALPLRTGDQFKIVAEVDRPAYLYLFWVDENGAGVPVYPWEQGKWDTRPADQQPVRTLELMAPNGKGFAVTGDAKGMETIVMLARSERLSTADAEVQGWFAGLKPLPFRGEQARVWFENFDVLRTDEKRGLKYGGDVAEVDGLTLIDEALGLEAIGFAAPGEGLRTLADDGRANPSGGGASGYSPPSMGLVRIVESVLQLRGTAGSVQQRSVRRAVATGGSVVAGQTQTVVLLEAAS